MKLHFLARWLIIAVIPAAAVITKGKLRTSKTVAVSEVTPKDLNECLQVASRFIHGPKDLGLVRQLSADFCVKTRPHKERDIVCPHFASSIDLALDGHHDDEMVTAEDFCNIVEARMLETRGATRIPNIGRGPLLNFTATESCEESINRTRGAPGPSEMKNAADLWYVTCLNQDCGSALPSRTRDCTKDHSPTHSSWVCDLGRRFIEEKSKDRKEDVSSRQICSWYGEFVKNLGIDIEAYEHVLHGDNTGSAVDRSDAAGIRVVIATPLLVFGVLPWVS